MLGWFKRRKKKKKEAALLKEQSIQEIEVIEETPQEGSQEQVTYSDRETTEPSSAPVPLERDITPEIEEAEKIDSQEFSEHVVEPPPVDIEESPEEDLLEAEVLENKKPVEAEIQVEDPAIPEIIEPEETITPIDDTDIFDDIEALGESPLSVPVPISVEPESTESEPSMEESDIADSTEYPTPVDTIEVMEEAFAPQDEEDLKPTETDSEDLLAEIEPVSEEPTAEILVDDEDISDGDESQLPEEIPLDRSEEPEAIREEPPFEEGEIIEDIEFIDDVEIYEETTTDLVSPVEDEEKTPESSEYQETEDLFKELLFDEETNFFDEQVLPEEAEKVEQESRSPLVKDIEVPVAPEVEETPEEAESSIGEEISTEGAPPEEPQFLEDVEIYEEPEEEAVPATTAPIEKPQDPRAASFFKRLADRLSKTRDSFINQMDLLFLGKKEIDNDLLDDLEELLITADLGVNTTRDLIEHAQRKIKRNELSDPRALKGLFKERLRSYILESDEPAELVMPDSGPFVIMVIGVNGVGKTTTIGKITHKFIQSGQSVLLVAADTFRAAAVSQLKIWGERNNVEVVSGKEGIDPSSVAYDAMEMAKAKDYDVVLVDTAGRLHTQTNLMEELKKIKRVMGKRLEGAPHEVLLVLDATTGQNGVSQAKLFNEAVAVSGLALTKLDGTAKGGIVANVCKELKIPIRFIGIGEQIDDLRDFDPDEFIEALFQER